MDIEEKVLTALRTAGKPSSAGEIEKASGLERKAVDKAFKTLKDKGLIISPVRCKWEPAKT